MYLEKSIMEEKKIYSFKKLVYRKKNYDPIDNVYYDNENAL